MWKKCIVLTFLSFFSMQDMNYTKGKKERKAEREDEDKTSGITARLRTESRPFMRERECVCVHCVCVYTACEPACLCVHVHVLCKDSERELRKQSPT